MERVDVDIEEGSHPVLTTALCFEQQYFLNPHCAAFPFPKIHRHTTVDRHTHILPHCALSLCPEYPSLWQTSGMLILVLHCQMKKVSDYWWCPSRKLASRNRETTFLGNSEMIIKPAQSKSLNLKLTDQDMVLLIKRIFWLYIHCKGVPCRKFEWPPSCKMFWFSRLLPALQNTNTNFPSEKICSFICSICSTKSLHLS